jgi:hypothetical protein
MPQLSVLLATVRERYALPAIAALQASLARIDHEIIVVSPFVVEGPGIRHIPETTPRGCYPAYQRALEAATGDVLAFFTDDVIAVPGWADGLVDEIRRAEAKAMPYLGALSALNWPMCFSIYGKLFANRPVFGCRTAAALQPMFGEEFPHHFGDGDLAMRVWEMGGHVDILTHRTVLLLSEHPFARSSSFAAGDKHLAAARRFQAKWATKFGADPNGDPDAIITTHRIAGM